MSEVVCDEGVQATNDDASECKRCAVQLGYWEDRYIPLLVRAGDRKTPEINRGYYARTKGVEMFIHKFLKKSGSERQIINLGSGFDTLYWRLKDAGKNVTNFVEIDFPNVTSRKCYLIKRNKLLLEKIHVEDPRESVGVRFLPLKLKITMQLGLLGKDGEVRLSATDLHAGNYHIVGVDLRNLHEVESKLHESEVKYNLPTLFLAECVLVYIDVPQVEQLLSWISKKFESALFVNYEMVNMGDKFGEVMLRNLRARGCPLNGVSACQNLSTQVQRFLSSNWNGSLAWDMVEVYNALPGSDRHRIEHIEFLDEQELLIQLFQHYCISIAWNGTMFSDIDIT